MAATRCRPRETLTSIWVAERHGEIAPPRRVAARPCPERPRQSNEPPASAARDVHRFAWRSTPRSLGRTSTAAANCGLQPSPNPRETSQQRPRPDDVPKFQARCFRRAGDGCRVRCEISRSPARAPDGRARRRPRCHLRSRFRCAGPHGDADPRRVRREPRRCAGRRRALVRQRQVRGLRRRLRERQLQPPQAAERDEPVPRPRREQRVCADVGGAGRAARGEADRRHGQPALRSCDEPLRGERHPVRPAVREAGVRDVEADGEDRARFGKWDADLRRRGRRQPEQHELHARRALLARPAAVPHRASRHLPAVRRDRLPADGGERLE